jgi:hypothetical protein
VVLRGKDWKYQMSWAQNLPLGHNCAGTSQISHLRNEVNRKSCVLLGELHYGKLLTSNRIMREVRISLINYKHFQQSTAFLAAFRTAKLFIQNAWKPAGIPNNVNLCNIHYFFRIQEH